MGCAICGDPSAIRPSQPWWDCDMGWKWAMLCGYCLKDAQGRRPRKEDFAYDKKDACDVN